MTVTEGGGRRAVARKFQDVYLPALKANFMVWPAVQLINFRVIPLPYQIVSIFREAYCCPDMLICRSLWSLPSALRGRHIFHSRTHLTSLLCLRSERGDDSYIITQLLLEFYGHRFTASLVG